MKTSKCRSCDAPVRWIWTAAGSKLMPINPDPDPAGNIEIVNDKAVVHAQVPLVAGDLYQSHWATCPQADQWRTKKGKRRERR